MTDNLHINSRRCATIYTLPTRDRCARTQAASGFSRNYDCGIETSVLFFFASRLPANSVSEDVVKLVGDENRELSSDGLDSSNPLQIEAKSLNRLAWCLNFVSSVRWGRAPEVAVLYFGRVKGRIRCESSQRMRGALWSIGGLFLRLPAPTDNSQHCARQKTPPGQHIGVVSG